MMMSTAVASLIEKCFTNKNRVSVELSLVVNNDENSLLRFITLLSHLALFLIVHI